MGERVVLGCKGSSSMVKIRGTDKAPADLNDITVPRRWGRSGRATSSSPTTSTASWNSSTYYQSNDYMIDND